MSLETNLSKLPEYCYTVSTYSKELIQIRRGEDGYHKCDLSTNDEAANRALADKFNAALGVSPEQEEAMYIGSMFGWHVPGADPDFVKAQKEEKISDVSSELSDEERGYSLNDGEVYLHIQTCEDGYDYTLYYTDFSEWDGGQLDEPDLSMDDAIDSILEEYDLQDAERSPYDPDELRLQTEKAEQAQLEAAREKQIQDTLDERIADAEERRAEQLKEQQERSERGEDREEQEEEKGRERS